MRLCDRERLCLCGIMCEYRLEKKKKQRFASPKTFCGMFVTFSGKFNVSSSTHKSLNLTDLHFLGLSFRSGVNTLYGEENDGFIAILSL